MEEFICSMVENLNKNDLYPNNLKNWFWTTRKLPRLYDLNPPNINNMRWVKIVQPQGFGAVQKPIFQVVWV